MVLMMFPFIVPLIGMNVGIATEIVIYSLFAVAFNILLGFTGLPSFGHAAFFGTGAYMVAILQYQGIENTAVALLSAALGAGIAAGLVGILVCKKRGIYFGLLTLAFGQMFFIVAMRWDEVTGGETGLTGLTRSTIDMGFATFDLNNQLTFYYFVLVVFILSILVIWRILSSPFGAVLQGIKENELRVQYLGYPAYLYKWAAIAISGLFSGLAGGLFAYYQFAAYPEYVFWVQSGNVVVATLIGGGLNSFFGPILGAAIFVGAEDLISSYTEHWMLFFGLLFISVVIFFPNGIPQAAIQLVNWVKGLGGDEHRKTDHSAGEVDK
ncbi:branched-chain amino acid ABC transporter permease [Roseovarius pelagicus]|uniref:Branched-chain amino acid ABC transporter permease n=1 Tax=Roseovarius pelagicus TaxID=2980108 RepID=A0ABY6D8U8_9RHOB|nr:branched-chain amino acid ABC transporter permease [Roseovarius pelagicus]UXX81603.1 branched-chain amino acid ABC transporter permease [Roseovarius pelagicus]